MPREQVSRLFCMDAICSAQERIIVSRHIAEEIWNCPHSTQDAVRRSQTLIRRSDEFIWKDFPAEQDGPSG